MMNNIDEQYLNLLKEIVENGTKRLDRTETGTIATFGNVIKHDMSLGFPLLTSKKMATKQIISELIWFMKGETNIRPLFEQKNYIWLGDAYKNYIKKTEIKDLNDVNKDSFTYWYYNTLDRTYRPFTKDEFKKLILEDDEFCEEFGDLGKIYGKQWRFVNRQVRTHLESYNQYKEDIKKQGINHKLLKSDLTHYQGEIACFETRAYTFDEFYKLIETKDPRFSEYFTTENVDQLDEMIKTIKTNPYSRRILVNSWNVSELNDMVLPPCHYSFQCFVEPMTKEEMIQQLNWDMGENFTDVKGFSEICKEKGLPTHKLSLMWNQRSADVPLGIPFNIASYAILLEILAKECNMVANQLIGCLGDTHIYTNQIETAKEQIKEPLHKLCTLKISDDVVFGQGLDKLLETLKTEHFTFENYVYGKEYKYPLSN